MSIIADEISLLVVLDDIVRSRTVALVLYSKVYLSSEYCELSVNKEDIAFQNKDLLKLPIRKHES